jgi:hypothetical protein
MTASIARPLAVAAAVALLLTQGTAAADAGKCQQAIVKESAKLIQTKAKALQKCEDGRVKGKLPASTDCVAEPKTALVIQKAGDKLAGALGKKCGGADKTCGTGGDDDPLGSIGWGSTPACPDFGSAGCTDAIADCGDVAACLSCASGAAAIAAVGVDYDDLVPAAFGTKSTLNKCQRAVGKEATKFLQARSKALQKCWDARLKGKHANPCPDPGDGKARAAIDKAEAKKVAGICKACGGADKRCGSGDDFLPAEIGFGASCADVTVPGAPSSCGAPVSTLEEMIACVDCVTSFAGECANRLAIPAFAAYPDGCNAGASSGSLCDDLGLPEVPFATGATGMQRGDLAAGFTVGLVGGGTFDLLAQWTGCETHVFIPDTLVTSELDATSLWAHDLDALIATSPRNVHYFFVSRKNDDGAAATSTAAMRQRIDDLLATLPAADASHWQAHLHVVAGRAATLGNWLAPVLAGHGASGFAIDRRQRVRDVGLLADVTRFSSALQNAGHWPWKRNLAYAAHEARWFNGEAARAAQLAPNPTVVPLWQGVSVNDAVDVDAMLPSAAEMAAFDTLEVEVALACPDPAAPELSSCGEWDYIATLSVTTPAGAREVARFLTAYGRETRWVVDATHVLPLFAAGGSHHFRWQLSQAQPTVTAVALRFASRGKGRRPTAATFLWNGGTFDAAYNTGRSPVVVPIPASAKRVELVAIITGHGNGTNQCAEFCDHQHEFTVDSAMHVASFPAAGAQDGCIAEASDGMIPNQGGTWWFGRGGWCPGQQVEPWVVDVTAAVTPGASATVTYRGLFNGVTPPNGSGSIVLASWLVVWE